MLVEADVLPGGPLSGIVGLFLSVVNTDLKWLFKTFAFSVWLGMPVKANQAFVKLLALH